MRLFSLILLIAMSSLAFGQAPTATPTSTATPIVAHTPIPPSSYTVPASTLGSDVTTIAALKTELAKTTSQVIVVANGTYDDTSYITNACRHKLWARTLHGAIFNVGINTGKNAPDCGTGSPEYHGLKFNVSSTSKVLNGDIIHNWGVMDKLIVEDLELNGNNVIESGIWSRPNDGFTARRIKLMNFTGYGLYNDGQRDDTVGALTPAPTPVNPITVQDIDVDQVALASPGTGGGSTEMAIWLGDKTTTCTRLRATNYGWSGLWTGSGFRDTTCSHMTFNTPWNYGKSTAVYFEHYTLDSIFEYFNIQASQVGFQCEWLDSPPYDGRPGCNRVTIRNGYINATCVGAYFDNGTRGTTMYNTVVEGASYAHTSAYLPDDSVDQNLRIRSGNVAINGSPTPFFKKYRSNHLNNYPTPAATQTPDYCKSF